MVPEEIDASEAGEIRSSAALYDARSHSKLYSEILQELISFDNKEVFAGSNTWISALTLASVSERIAKPNEYPCNGPVPVNINMM